MKMYSFDRVDVDKRQHCKMKIFVCVYVAMLFLNLCNSTRKCEFQIKIILTLSRISKYR